MDRRGFLRAAGKAGTGIALGSLPLINSCKGNGIMTPEPPPKPVPVNLDFKVYNHTQGLQAQFSQNNAMSGSTLTFSVSDIASRYGIRNVDPVRIVIRKANFGAYVDYSNQGTAKLGVPRENASFDIFLFNAAGSQLYAWGDAQRWVLRLVASTSPVVYRQDEGGRTGEERVWGGEFLPETGNLGVFDQYNELLHPAWANFSYGNFERIPDRGSGTFSYGFADCNGADSLMGYVGPPTARRIGLEIDPIIVPRIKDQVALGLGLVLEQIAGQVPDIGDQRTYKSLGATEGVLSQVGKDEIAYLFVKYDPNYVPRL